MTFHIPFIGMELTLGTKLTTRDTHKIEIDLSPPCDVRKMEVCEGRLDALADAIATIRAAVASAVDRDDPFLVLQ